MDRYDMCDLCLVSGVTVSSMTYCGKAIGIQCGCEEEHLDGNCGDHECSECSIQGVIQEVN